MGANQPASEVTGRGAGLLLGGPPRHARVVRAEVADAVVLARDALHLDPERALRQAPQVDRGAQALALERAHALAVDVDGRARGAVAAAAQRGARVLAHEQRQRDGALAAGDRVLGRGVRRADDRAALFV